MNLQTLTLHFENLETFHIPAAHIQHLYLNDIQTNKEFHSADEPATIRTAKTIEHVMIQFKPDANVQPADPQTFGHAVDLTDQLMNYCNLSALTLHYDDNSEERLYVKWNAKQSDEQNSYQSTALDSNGELCLVVSETRRAISYITRAVATSV